MRLCSTTSILLMMLVIIMGGCGRGHDSDRVAIAVSFEPQAWMLRQIAGEDFDIVTLLPAGSDPETYQPSISTMKGLGNAVVFFTLGTDGFEKSLISNVLSNFPELKVVDCTEGVEKIYGNHGNHSDDGLAHGDEAFDPHILASIKNSILIADNLTHYIAVMYPETSAQYREAGEELKKRLKMLDDSISNMEIAGKSFAMRHPSLSYFARDYGLSQITLQASGKDMSPLRLRRQMEQLQNEGTKVYVMEKEHFSGRDKETAGQLGLHSIDVSLNSSEWLNDLIKTANEINRD